MARIRPKAVTPSDKGLSKRELYATVCLYYPQYKLSDVQNMPYRDVKLLLRVAWKRDANLFFNLTQIAAAPHTKNGSGVKKLLETFREAGKK